MHSVKAGMLRPSCLLPLLRTGACRRRQIVSAAYTLQPEWNVRLDTPALKTIDSKQLVLTMHQQAQAQTPIASVDIDILANRLANLDLTLLPTFESVLKAFRTSQNSMRGFPSTSHAIVRGLIELGEFRRLMNLLPKKDEFGVFLDSHATCLAIRHAINDLGESESAARLACDYLLQERGFIGGISTPSTETGREELESEAFANCIAFGALHRFIVSLLGAGGESKVLSAMKKTDTSSAKDPTDDIIEWVRVDAVRNAPAFPWLALFNFEDPPATIGYSLRCFVEALRSVKSSKDAKSGLAYRTTSPSIAQAVASNYELIALALLQRADDANQLLKNFSGAQLCPETIRICEAAGFKLPDTVKASASSTPLQQVGDTFVADVLQRCESAQVDRAKRTYAAWNTRRADELAEHARRFATERRRGELKSQLTKLLETEELLTFFKKQREIELRAWLAPRSRAERKRRAREQYEEELRNVLKEKARIKSYLEALPTD